MIGREYEREARKDKGHFCHSFFVYSWLKINTRIIIIITHNMKSKLKEMLK